MRVFRRRILLRDVCVASRNFGATLYTMLNTSDNMVTSLRTNEWQLCAFWFSSLINGLQHFHFPSQKINVVLTFQQRHSVVADIPIT